MDRIELRKGINLYTLKDDKFKSFRVCVLLHRPLSRQEATLNTLLTATMRMQSKNFPSAREISEELENLYGGEMIARASKYGERHIIKLGIQSVSDNALGEKGNFKRAMRLLSDLVLCSGTGEGFSDDIVRIEKKNIKDSISAQKNDKRTYSVLRLQEEMCKGEPYGVNPMGYIEDLDKIDAKELYAHYKKVLCESRIDIFFTGNFDEEEAKSAASHFAANLDEREIAPAKEVHKELSGDIRIVRDKMDVTQGKLCMGFRCKEGLGGEDYAKTVVYNSIFGGSAVSKLFNNVREKLSLCYYVGSSVDRLKEIMIVRSGVEFENFKTAYDEIMHQQKMMENGDFTEEEIQFAKKQLTSAYEANIDSIASMEEYYIMQLLLGTDISIPSMVDMVNKVTKEDIILVAKGMELDTVYYMEGEA